MTMTSILFLTNHMTDITGSSVVILEFAEELKSIGFSVTIGAIVIGPPVRDLMAKSGFEYFEVKSRIDVSRYTAVWSQHLMFGWVDLSSLCEGGRKRILVFSHLSPNEPIEKVTYPNEEDLADLILFNSEETKQSNFIGDNADRKSLVFYNCAPAGFQQVSRKSDFRRVLTISNHVVPELRDASVILKYLGYHVESIGVHSGNYRRVVPLDVMWADVIITIGKSAVYAIVGRKPVYIYGPHGGSGYLTDQNFEINAFYNFSGRPASVRKSANEIVSELENQFTNAQNYSDSMSSNTIERYQMDQLMSRLLSEINCFKPMPVYNQETFLRHENYFHVCSAWSRFFRQSID